MREGVLVPDTSSDRMDIRFRSGGILWRTSLWGLYGCFMERKMEADKN